MSESPQIVEWSGDEELFELCRAELFTALVGDVMDKLGLRRQFLPPQIRPLREEMVVIGRAMTVLEADCHEERSERSNNPVMSRSFGLMLGALDDLKPGEVYLCGGASPDYALWGELMSCRAMQCGAVGAVVDGYSRDTPGVLDTGLPVFSHGPYAQDQAPRGKVIDWRCPIRVGQVLVQDGDLVFGDIDGVCIVPAAQEGEVIRGALGKARGEKTVKRAIQQGMSACDVFATYGIM